jgi:predicted flap endonuclease-1-like 5' DNA nuclease
MVMTEFLNAYLPAILIAVLIGIVVGFLIFRPRQRVRLTDSAPLRPHMTSRSRDSRREANDLASEAAAAASDVTGEFIGAPVHRHLSGGGDTADDFVRLKGIGPKLADLLHARGFSRFEQLAHLTSEEIDILDAQLGAFRGRIRRDRIVEQAAYLARGDTDGFEQHFGKL